MQDMKERILIVDDSEMNRSLTMLLLGNTYVYEEAENGRQAIEILKSRREEFKMIILDLIMPEVDGYMVLDWISRQNYEKILPVLILSVDESSEVIHKAYEMGASAYLARNSAPPLLIHMVEFLIKTANERKTQDEIMEQYAYRATHDGLTGLINQGAQRELAEKLLEENPDTEYVMVVIDVDHFKQYNDTKGHEFGNRLLKQVAENGRRLIQENGLFARSGGDEFLMLIPAENDIYQLGRKIMDAFTFLLEDVSVQVSVGLALTAYVGRKYNDLFHCADSALYSSKRNGRGRFTVYVKTDEETKVGRVIDHEILSDLSKGMSGGFFVYRADESEEILYMNEELYRIFGCESEERFRTMVGNSFKGIVHPDDLNRVEHGIQSQIHEENGGFDYVEYRIIKADGSVSWVEDHGRYIYTSQYGYVYYVFIKELKARSANAKSRILIVDDQEMNRDMLEDILSDTYEVESVGSGREAIYILDTMTNRYDMLLLDLIMPDVDGFAVLEHMNKYHELYNLPVIVISTDTQSGTINRAYDLGAMDVIARPYNAGLVRRRIRNCIEIFNRPLESGIPEELKKKVLIVETNKFSQFFLSKILGDSYEVIPASTVEEAKMSIQSYQDELALIILDLHISMLDGYEFMDWMKEHNMLEKIPILAETVPEVYEENLHVLYSGASDFITKPYRPEIVKKRVDSLISRRETVKLIHDMQYDEVTGLYTYQYFDFRLEEILRRNRDKQYDLVWTNIISFKTLNDRYGMELGDTILKLIAGSIIDFEEIVLAGRVNADHFLLVLEHNNGQTEEVIRRFDEKMHSIHSMPFFGLNYGIYSKIDPSLTIRQITDRAMIAGKNRSAFRTSNISFYNDTIRQKMLMDQRLTEQMDQALAGRQFVVYYQPKINLKTGKASGLEALVRWRHPAQGFISPGAFIPLFENNGFIRKLDQYILENAASDLREWMDKGYPVVPISVNVSRRDFEVEDFIPNCEKHFEKHRIPADLIHMEVTESMYADNMESIISQVDQIRRRGIKIEMDDFGAGYSSLGMLTDMPLDVVKLDISFVRKLEQKKEVVRSVIELSHRLGYEVVAEGAETEDQVMTLKELDCDVVQGYFYSKPLPKPDLEKFLLDQFAGDRN